MTATPPEANMGEPHSQVAARPLSRRPTKRRRISPRGHRSHLWITPFNDHGRREWLTRPGPPTASPRESADVAELASHSQSVEPHPTAGDDALHSIPVLIFDDCTLHRDSLAAVLATRSVASVSVAWDLPSLMTSVTMTRPTVVLVDMATHATALVIRALKDIRPSARVIVIGVSEDDEQDIVECAEAGVAGYHLRTESLDALIALIHRVAVGDTSCPTEISAILLRRISALADQQQKPPWDPGLTSREAQILTMLELGRSNQEIAQQLSIAVHTVKNHVHNVLAKLGVATRAEAAALSRSARSERMPHTRTRPRFR
jgi:DNA-binding NarL/FixJ family response regulator